MADELPADMDPLEYMLAVMNDPTAEIARRDRMAIAAAPFVHDRVVSGAKGKKLQPEYDAETVHLGTEWEALLR